MIKSISTTVWEYNNSQSSFVHYLIYNQAFYLHAHYITVSGGKEI